MRKNILICYKDKSKEKVSNVDLKLFDTSITFDLPSDKNIDEYISSEIILELNKIEFGVIYIKDSLSSNYLELYGLRVAYHIRLSQELENKKYVPIVILSDIDSHILNKLDPMARILFTKNIFIIKNTKEDIKKFQDKSKCKNLTEDEYKTKFLNLIELEAPKESRHDIANEWAIYKWAKELKIPNSDNINNILEKLSSQLYFKYIKSKYSILDVTEIPPPLPKRVLGNKMRIQHKANVEEKRILYIDDEHNKGWNDIFKEYFSKKRGYKFEALDIPYKVNSFIEIEKPIIDTMGSYKPDLIILDMRLIDLDHKKETLPEDISGIKILNSIKNISIETKLNPGIQVIMLTASGRSDILDEALKNKKIVGYIKKEHPEDITINTKENIEKLDKFIDIGEENFYLKEIWDIQYNILNLDLFNDKKYNQIKVEISFIFEILNTDIENKFKFSMLIIYKVLEMIRDLYIDDKSNRFIDNEIEIKVIYPKDNLYKEFNKNDFINGYGKHHYLDKKDAQKYYYSTANKVHAIAYEKLLIKDTITHDVIDSINKRRNGFIHPPKENTTVDVTSRDIIEWFKILQTILEKINAK